MKYIFLHGLGQTNKDWQEIMDQLENQDTQALTLNNPQEKDLRFQELQQRIENHLNALDEDFILIGLSLGGMIALEYASHPSPHLKGLVVSGSQYKIDGKRLYDLQILLYRLIPRFIFSKLLKQEKETALNFAKALLHFNIENQLPLIECPTQIIIGSIDLPNRPAAKDLVRKIKDASYYKIKMGGHQLNKTHQKEFARIIEDFSKRLDERK